MSRSEPLIITDSVQHALVCDNLAVEQLGVAAYLGVPLVHEAHVLGSFCVIDDKPRGWTKSDLASLKQFASLAASELANRKEANKKQFELENRLRQSQKMEAIGQLTTGVAHDFVNVLWAIQISTDLLNKESNLNAADSAQVEHIRSAVSAARGMISQLLSWSRPSQHAVSAVSLTEIVNQALPLLRTMLSSFTEIAFDSEDQGRIFADPNQIHQILLNLCCNADHAMGTAGGEILLSVATKEFGPTTAREFGLDPGVYVELRVKDQGCGIPPEQLHRIHDPYFTTKPVGEGTGLGLWTVFGIVRRHDGQIRVESIPGVGTTFRILFPQAAESGRATSDAMSSPHLGARSSACAMIVVADGDLSSALEQKLSSCGIETVSFASSPSAFEYFIRDAPGVDLLIADQGMSILSGPELGQRCRLLKPELPMIVLGEESSSAAASCTLDESGSSTAADAFVSIPIENDALVAVVKRLLNDRA